MARLSAIVTVWLQLNSRLPRYSRLKLGKRLPRIFSIFPYSISSTTMATEVGHGSPCGSIRDSRAAYASKVNASTSLKGALIRDLSQDFSYPANQTFVIDEIAARDTSRDRHGGILTRLLVIVGLDARINLKNIHPLGMNLHWYEEGSDEYNAAKEHFLSLSLDLYHSQSYVHISMDGSRPADPGRGPTDEYYLPGGSLIEPAPPIWY